MWEGEISKALQAILAIQFVKSDSALGLGLTSPILFCTQLFCGFFSSGYSCTETAVKENILNLYVNVSVYICTQSHYYLSTKSVKSMPWIFEVCIILRFYCSITSYLTNNASNFYLCTLFYKKMAHWVIFFGLERVKLNNSSLVQLYCCLFIYLVRSTGLLLYFHVVLQNLYFDHCYRTTNR